MTAAEPVGDGVMAVQTALVKEFLVGQIQGWVVEHYSQRLAPEIETALVETGIRQSVARAGYLARIAETQLFEPARKPSSQFAANLQEVRREGAAVSLARVSAEAANAETTERPDPDDPAAMSWRVPGPGGHVRHYVALEAIAWLTADPPDLAAAGLKQSWLYGFFLRCCQEAADPDLVTKALGS